MEPKASCRIPQAQKKGPVEEIEVTPEVRQEMFDRQETTDDHGMEIVGIATDQKGNRYYKVKNSCPLSCEQAASNHMATGINTHKQSDIRGIRHIKSLAFNYVTSSLLRKC